jgi:hypothetical protein
LAEKKPFDEIGYGDYITLQILCIANEDFTVKKINLKNPLFCKLIES